MSSRRNNNGSKQGLLKHLDFIKYMMKQHKGKPLEKQLIGIHEMLTDKTKK